MARRPKPPEQPLQLPAAEPKRPLEWSPPDWMPIDEVLARIKAGAGTLATNDLLRDLISGRLQAAARGIVVVFTTDDGTEVFLTNRTGTQGVEWASRDIGDAFIFNTIEAAHRAIDLNRVASSHDVSSFDVREICKLCARSYWKGTTLSELGEPPGRVWVSEAGKDSRSQWAFYVRRADVEKHYPPGPQQGEPQEGELPDTKPRQRPGSKPKGYWDELVAAELIRLAVKGDRLDNVDALVGHMKTFLEAKIKWAPQDPEQIRKKILRFLQFVR